MQNHIHITEIPEDVKVLEQCPALNVLMKKFSKKVDAEVKIGDFLSDLFLLEKFDDFIRIESLCGTLPVSIDPKLSPRAQELITDFKKRYGYIVRASDKYYVDIREKLYGDQINDPEKIEQIKKDMRNFLAAYHLAKKLFEDVNREGIKPGETVPERYFNHLTGTTDIILNELPNPNINTVVMGILHDTIEDIRGIDANVMISIFGEYIAKGVDLVSKKDIEKFYLSPHQLEKIKKTTHFNSDEEKLAFEQMRKQIIAKAKLDRQDDYFGHLDELEDDYLTVKFADRIHNLRTLDGMGIPAIVKKVKETEKYFLSIAKKRNPTAYKLIQDELRKIKAMLAGKCDYMGVSPNNAISLANGMEAFALNKCNKVEGSDKVEGGPDENIGMRVNCQFGSAIMRKDGQNIIVYGFWDTFTGECLWRSLLPGEKKEDIKATLHDYDVKFEYLNDKAC